MKLGKILQKPYVKLSRGEFSMDIKKIRLAILLIVVVSIFYTDRIVTTFLYYKNGSVLILRNYNIDFPLSHWGYFNKSQNGYELSGRRINNIVLTASVYEPKVSIENILNKKCDRLRYENKEFKNVKGRIYYCFSELKDIEFIYFQTEDNRLMIESSTYNKNNIKNVFEYNLLFDSIR